MNVRRALYGAGLLASETPPRPVVSIGNLTLGGTGKTPAVAWALERLIEAGIRPGAVSRGYGGAAAGVSVVSDGAGAALSCPPASDEAAMLARRFPSVPIVTGRDRPAAVRRAAELGAEVILSDDGFQHLALGRSLDIVLLRGERPLGNGRVIPAGALREPEVALGCAHAILLTGGTGGTGEAKERAQALAPGAKVFEGSLKPAALLDLAGRPAGAPSELSGAAVVTVSGIGNPAGFAQILAGLGARIEERLDFPDHAAYGEEELRRILSALERSGADLIVTTEKDAVKLSPLTGDTRFRVLGVRMEIRDGDALARLILDAVR
jgi:tetraacyldisaccharide 4'-kinase